MTKMSYSEFQSNFGRRFGKQKSIKLRSLIDNGKRNEIITKGTLVLMPFSNSTIQLKILEKDTIDKGFSIPLRLNEQAKNYNITQNYLLWYLQTDFVVLYLLGFVKGSALLRISRADLFEILVPIPLKNISYKSPKKLIKLDIKDDPFRVLINNYYRDYRLNLKNERFQTSSILAGSIMESILYQLLIDSGVDKSILQNDNSLSLGKMIQYIKLLKLDKELGLPMSAICEVQKNRNKSVHVNLAIKDKSEYTIKDQECFNEVIKYFGI